jgi:quercetin dioxygenase-like cupin family protein
MSLVVRKCRELAAGESIGGHQHRNGHHAFVMRGSVQYEFRDGSNLIDSGELTAPAEKWVPGGVIHDFIAVEPGSLVWCVFSGEAL